MFSADTGSAAPREHPQRKYRERRTKHNTKATFCVSGIINGMLERNWRLESAEILICIGAQKMLNRPL